MRRILKGNCIQYVVNQCVFLLLLLKGIQFIITILELYSEIPCTFCKVIVDEFVFDHPITMSETDLGS